MSPTAPWSRSRAISASDRQPLRTIVQSSSTPPMPDERDVARRPRLERRGRSPPARGTGRGPPRSRRRPARRGSARGPPLAAASAWQISFGFVGVSTRGEPPIALHELAVEAARGDGRSGAPPRCPGRGRRRRRRRRAAAARGTRPRSGPPPPAATAGPLAAGRRSRRRGGTSSRSRASRSRFSQGGACDVDVDDPGPAGTLEEALDLRPREPELAGDLLLGPAVHVVAVGDPGEALELVVAEVLGAHRTPVAGNPGSIRRRR